MMIWNGIMIKLARTTTQLRLLSNSKLKLNENGKEWVTDYKDDDLSVKLNLVQFFNDLKRFFFNECDMMEILISIKWKLRVFKKGEVNLKRK